MSEIHGFEVSDSDSESGGMLGYEIIIYQVCLF